MSQATAMNNETEKEFEPPAELVSREPWWAKPPAPGQNESELEWGYLEIYSDGRFHFDRTRPSDEEIRNRHGCWISRDSD